MRVALTGRLAVCVSSAMRRAGKVSAEISLCDRGKEEWSLMLPWMWHDVWPDLVVRDVCLFILF